jgi:hypothetical protein
MTVTAEEFIRRFLMHILPRKFVKIRHYGILSNRNRKLKLQKSKILLGMTYKKSKAFIESLSSSELLLKLTGIDICKCPSCKKGKMIHKNDIIPRICSPPGEVKLE